MKTKKMQCSKIFRYTVLLVFSVTLSCLVKMCFFSSYKTPYLPSNFKLEWVNHNSYSKDFVIENDLIFPHSAVLKQPKYLKNAHWIAPLINFLRTATSKQITLIAADYNFLPVTLNWLISALVKTQPPLENVLVIALDEKLYNFLQRLEDVDSVYVDPWSVIIPGAKMQSKFSHIWIARMCVFRLLNHWGFDVAHYDVDAIVLKNLQPIFDEYKDSDVIGSYGKYPFDLGRKWGQTFCMGAALLRSTSRTELFWETVSTVNTDAFDDQVRFNQALNDCAIIWDSDRHRDTPVITGQCTKVVNCNTSCASLRLKVSLLPENVVCRHCKVDRISSYHVWHSKSSRNSTSKQENAKNGHVWFLKQGWNLTPVNSVKSYVHVHV